LAGRFQHPSVIRGLEYVYFDNENGPGYFSAEYKNKIIKPLIDELTPEALA